MLPADVPVEVPDPSPLQCKSCYLFLVLTAEDHVSPFVIVLMIMIIHYHYNKEPGKVQEFLNGNCKKIFTEKKFLYIMKFIFKAE